MKKRTRDKRIRRLAASALILASIFCGVYQPEARANGFQQAVLEYNQGHYTSALSEFQTFKRAYPNNALVRYYLALCHQALNHIDEAKAEYEWVGANAPADLAGKAKMGLSRLSGVRTSVAFSGSSGAAASSGASQEKVRRILEFYADY